MTKCNKEIERVMNCEMENSVLHPIHSMILYIYIGFNILTEVEIIMC
jgi:hypothetical protein